MEGAEGKVPSESKVASDSGTPPTPGERKTTETPPTIEERKTTETPLPMYEIKGTILKKSKYDDGSNNSQGTSAPPSRGQSSIGDSTDFDTPDSSAAGTPNGSRVKKDSLARKLKRLRRTSMLRTKGKNRRDHFRHLLMKRKIRAAIERKLGRSGKSMGESGAESGAESESDIDMDASTKTNASYRLLRAEVEEDMGIEKGDREQDTMGKVKEAQLMLKEYYRYAKKDVRNLSLEVRMESLCYSVPISSEAGKVMTVYNSSFLYPVYKFFQRTWRGEKKEPSRIGTKKVLDDINLVLKPGKMYLVLGPPTSGKSTLLRAITANLHPGKEDALEGAIKYNGQTLEGQANFHVENACAYIDQLDKHAARLTVAETFEFAYQCQAGRPERRRHDFEDTEEAQKFAVRSEKEHVRLNVVASILGLSHVKDTFVGDEEIRGVSGGQRRRVTVGEMVMSRTPVLCGDEISTGLDATSTYDMVQALLHFGKAQKMTRVFALLQPGPDTVSLFDEVILLAEGKILFAGPIEEVEDYFAEIGYQSPPFMDVADFLQMVSTEDGATLYDPPADIKEIRPNPPTISELADLYRESPFATKIKFDLASEHEHVWHHGDPGSYTKSVSEVGELPELQRKYANNFLRSSSLILNRSLTLWIRDKRVIIAGAAKNILMGVSVGGVFLNADDPISIQGALFQTGLFIMLGAMQNASALVADRVVFYKHRNANFFSAAPFVFGRSLSQLPQTTMETVMFATIMFFMVGFADRDFVNYLVYLSILLVFAILMNQQLAVFASFATASTLQACSACLLLLLTLLGGFIVAPDIIPNYLIWLYWWNPFAWTYRALIVNEFRSARYEDPDTELIRLGFVLENGDPFGQEWVGYSFLYLIPYLILCAVLTGLGLTYVRDAGGAAPDPMAGQTPKENGEDGEDDRVTIEIPFKAVDLSFSDICYEVKASTSKEQLKLLNNVNGIFRGGRLCALMGSSGAGKTTLMDVIALRKSSGTISGEIRLNGWPQDPVSFRRCSGYVEQFDVQSPQLTVRETILFSAKLRLDPTLVQTDHDKEFFVDQIIKDAELTSLADALVGMDEGPGLSFEQKKRLSIAVELAASPSVIFLDEPTSGLDSRSALLVVKTLRRIADQGRTVCATIHQPSSAVFVMFDDLLLMQRGGNVVFNGALGDGCRNLLQYFESRGAPKIEVGENPANWMLKVMTTGEMGDPPKLYVESDGYASLKEELNELKQNPDPDRKIEYESEFAVSRKDRQGLINARLRTVYWRSPAYNLARLTVAVVIGFVLGCVFVTKRNQDIFTENDMRARLSVIFLTFIIMGILAILSCLPVMTKIRDMFYRHRAAGMYDSLSIAWALGTAEKWFIVLTSALFTLVFLGVSGMTGDNDSLSGLIGYFGFFTFNFAIYSYFGQAFVCLVKPMPTAIILSSVFIGLNNFFAGLIVRPQLMVGGFYALPYYICPGHYVYEGMVNSLFNDDDRTVVADEGTEFYDFLQITCAEEECTEGTVDQYIDVFFGGEFSGSSVIRNNTIILGFILVVTRVLTFVCLKYIRFS